MEDLGNVLGELVQACFPTVDDYDKRNQLIHKIQKALEKISSVQNLRVVPYGSFVSGFYNSTSDLDLAICGSVPSNRLKPAALSEIFRGSPEESHVALYKLDKRSRTQLLRDVGNRLISAGLVSRSDVEFILHARVPLVKFTERSSGIEVDLCLGQDATAFKAWSVAQLASIHPAFGKLFTVVKVWAKAHAINDGAAHMFNSWCLTLVVIFFLQTHPQPPLLPPLVDLLYETPPPETQPRLLQDGQELPQQVYEVMAARVAQARSLYGSRPCPPLATLFRDFVADGAVKLRSLLASQKVLPRATRISAFYGSLLHDWPFSADYVLAVEDPYDHTDNTARTLGTWEGHPGTIHYVTSVFERTLRHIDKHMGAAHQPAAAATRTPPATSSTGLAASVATSLSATADENSPSSSASSASPPCPSLASTLVFLFGPELLSRLPALSHRLLGPDLEQWARAALAAGRPAGEVHTGMLQRLGAAGEFVSFNAFKARHSIRVLNEAKYATPEERAAQAAAAAARATARKERKKEKRDKKNNRQGQESGAHGTASAAGPSEQDHKAPPPPLQKQSHETQGEGSEQPAHRRSSASGGDGGAGGRATEPHVDLIPTSAMGQSQPCQRQAAPASGGPEDQVAPAGPGQQEGRRAGRRRRGRKGRMAQQEQSGGGTVQAQPHRASETDEGVLRRGAGEGAGPGMLDQAAPSGGKLGPASGALTSALQNVRISGSGEPTCGESLSTSLVGATCRTSISTCNESLLSALADAPVGEGPPPCDVKRWLEDSAIAPRKIPSWKMAQAVAELAVPAGSELPPCDVKRWLEGRG